MTAPVIAILDPDPSFLSLMHDLLAGAGYDTLLWQVQRKADAHALLRRARPDLIILDLWWEEHDDGWEFLKRLWGDVETTQIPAIIVSEMPEHLPVRADVLRALGCEIVRRPFNLRDLLTAIEGICGPARVPWDGVLQ